MRFLPIVDRELRVAARRRGIYALRVLAAAAALAVTLWLCLAPTQGQPPTALGKSLFTALSIMAFAYSLLIGPFLTADCISAEKREGTLGLLFLTNLRNFDVVLGKWAATSLAGFYGLVAVLPALSIPLLIGGVTPGEYGRTALAVLNAILFSLTAGMFVSAISRDQTKAILGSLILVLTLSGLLPGLMVLLFSGFLGSGVSGYPPAALASPVYAGQFAVDAAFRTNPGLFWISLGVVHASSWLFAVGTILIVARVWRQEPAARTDSILWWSRVGRTRRWQRRLVRRLESNPVYALASRHRWPHWVFWALVGIVTINIYWLTIGARRNPGLLQFHLHFSTAMYFINRVWIAAMACRFFVESRRNHGLELMLTTPLEVGRIVWGRRRALVRLFFWPVLAIGLLHWGYFWGSWQPYAKQPNSEQVFRWQALLATGSLASFVTDVLAMSALGGWLSLASRRLPFVILTTFTLITLVPWATMHLFGGAQLLQKWYPRNYFVALPIAWVAKNTLFFAWAMYKTRRNFRAAAAEQYDRGPGTVRADSGA